jgi:hypothetical protein
MKAADPRLTPQRVLRECRSSERSHQQAIAALEHDRCSRDCDRRQRIPLPLDIQRWGLPHAPPSSSHRQHATSRRHRHRALPPISIEERHKEEGTIRSW